MAKKTESQVSSRVLTKVIAGTVAELKSSETTFAGGEGWVSVDVLGGTYRIIYNIQTIDLSGYTIQDKTLFPQGILMQDMSPVPWGATGWPPPIQRVTLVSTTPINESDLITVDGTGWHVPGSNGSTHSLQNILQGRLQYFVTLSTFTGLQQIKESMWGSGDSTAAEKIWLCDAHLMPVIVDNQYITPDQAFVLPSLIAKEEELEYFMRLSRSLEPVY